MLYLYQTVTDDDFRNSCLHVNFLVFSFIVMHSLARLVHPYVVDRDTGVDPVSCASLYTESLSMC